MIDCENKVSHILQSKDSASMNTAAMSGNAQQIFPSLQSYIRDREKEMNHIPLVRKEELMVVSNYIRDKRDRAETAKLIFICTHNSRRSHLAQIWAQVAAYCYGIVHVETFSGGTESTALNPRAAAALARAGLHIATDTPNSANPLFRISYSPSVVPLECFSKIYNAPPNPNQHFAAIMTCSQADEGCPLVHGCELRIPIRYEDPKIADDTEHEMQRYDERAAQICSEMLYMMSLV